MNSRAQEIIDYWYGNPVDEGQMIDARFDIWFGKSDQADQEIKQLFSDDVNRVIAGDYDSWLENPLGRLANIILIDQFCRQIYRGTAKAFEHDHLALKYCLNGIELGHDLMLLRPLRYFYYLPLEHSEDIDHQHQCLAAFQAMVNESPKQFKKMYVDAVGYVDKHLIIIERFGRFPHRNEILGRKSTEEEIEFLKQPGSSF